MLIKRLVSLLVVLASLLTGCEPGYQKEDGKWAYVTYDEAAGKRVNYLEVDEQTFVSINKGYTKDKSKVLYEGSVIETADPKTFEIIGKGYSKDDFQVYLDNEIVIGADPKTFRILDFPYSRDDKNVYNGTLPMKVRDIGSFEVVSSTGMKSTELTTHFIKANPEYSFIDTTKYTGVIYGQGEAVTRTERFKGF